jgi:PPOX class probable FMN-dependent enzyme
MARIITEDSLRAMYPAVTERAKLKELTKLEKHSRRFIELAPFLVVATIGKDGRADNSPRGEKPGFVQVLDDKTIAIPDRPGNNRLDTFSNIIANPNVGLLFMVPGVSEILRINGRAELRDDADLKQRFVVNGKEPLLVVVVTVEEAYLHCAKAIMRSGLWDPKVQVPRSVMPTMGEMIRDQIGRDIAVESQEELDRRHRSQFY